MARIRRLIPSTLPANRCAARHYLSGMEQANLYGTSPESGLQGSGIPAGDFSVDVIDFLAK